MPRPFAAFADAPSGPVLAFVRVFLILSNTHTYTHTQDDNNKASVCTKDNVGKVQYITKEEKFQACVPVGNAFEWAAISSGADEGPYVGLEVTERFEDWLYAGPVGIPTSNRLLGGKSAWNLRDTWSWSTQVSMYGFFFV